MKLKQIVALSGYNYSTVQKVLYLKRYNGKFRKETVEKIQYYKNFGNLIDKELRNGTFEQVCEVVLNKATKRDCRNLEDVLELARDIAFLRDENQGLHTFSTPDKYTATDIFLDEDFSTLCSVALKLIKRADLRTRLMDLRDSSRYFRKKLGIIRPKKHG
jgi:hypothetical protein